MNVTVTFTCTAGSSTVTNCPAPQVVSSEGANQVVSSTVTDANEENLYSIIDIEMKKMSKRLAEQGIKLELTDGAREFLIETGYNPDFGARPLRRAIEHNVEDGLSESILRGDFKGTNLVKIHRDGDKLRFEAINTAAEQATPAASGAAADAT